MENGLDQSFYSLWSFKKVVIKSVKKSQLIEKVSFVHLLQNKTSYDQFLYCSKMLLL